MAKRKQKGAAFGKKSGGGSVTAYQKKERSRIGLYALIGIFGVLLFCVAIFISSGIDFGGGATTDSGSSESIDSGFDADNDAVDSSGDDGFEASSDSIADDNMVEEVVVDSGDGFSAESASMAIEEIDEGAFSFLEGSFSMSDIDPVERNAIYSDYPEFIIDESNTYDALIVTEKGDIRVRLFDDAAPLTVNNFVYLAQDGFYDGTTFHRVLEDFMAQAGDPTGSGSGGPGYQFEDETNNGFQFDRGGLLAMANAGPATNGSQFFLTYEPTPWLDGNHTIFGEIIEGTDVLDAIRLRDPMSDPQPGDLIETIEIYVTQ